MLKGSTKDLELTLVERLGLSGQAEWLLGGGELGLPGMAICKSPALQQQESLTNLDRIDLLKYHPETTGTHL